jgi:hypothetical protein
MTIYHARLETRLDTFDGYGLTAAEARKALQRAYEDTRRRGGTTTPWAEVRDDVQLRGAEVGKGYVYGLEQAL